MRFIRYEESRPAALRAMLAETPTAYLPIGPLRWEGEALPLGQAGIRARRFCEEAAAQTGGVVFPTIFWGAFDTMPFPFTFHFERKHLESLVDQLLPQLSVWGFQVIVLLTGHYPPTQIKMLKDACRSFNKQGSAISRLQA